LAEKAAILSHVSTPTSLGKFKKTHYFTRGRSFYKIYFGQV
jgi:hypothetical protein